MIRLEETAYPRFKDHISHQDLREIYTVTADELAFVRGLTRPLKTQCCALIQLKVLQRLGRPHTLSAVPRVIVEHVAKTAGFQFVPHAQDLHTYDEAEIRRKQWPKLLEFRELRAIDAKARAWLVTVAEQYAHAKHNPRDLVDVMCEFLVANRQVLPDFAVLETIAEEAHRKITDEYMDKITNSLSREARKMIDDLLVTSRSDHSSGWNRLKTEPKSPTPQNVRAHLQHIRIIRQLAEKLPRFDVPAPKLQHFRDWARSRDVAEMREMRPNARYALGAVFVRSQFATAMDDVAEILVKQVQNIETSARRHLTEHNLEHTDRAEQLIRQLQDVLEAYELKGSATQRINAIESSLIAEAPALIERCIEHLAYAGGNFRPLMRAPFEKRRPLLFSALEILELKTSSDDTVTERLVGNLLEHRTTRKEHVHAEDLGIDIAKDLAWLDPQWRKLVIEPAASSLDPPLINRKFLELAVIYQVKEEIKNGDLFVPDGEKYDDFREQLVSDAVLDAELPEFEKVSGLPADGKRFVEQTREDLKKTTAEVDLRFPENEHAEIVDDMLVLTRLKRAPLTEAIKKLDFAVTERMIPVSVVDVIVECVKWLGLDKHFKPISGRQPKMEDHLRRTVITIFCYGCNLGASQTARSVRDFSRRQVSWLNLKNVTEEKLNDANEDVINAYNRFELPRYWGTGASAAADGKHWRMWEENMVSEYHIRYGSFGGIGYYHIADNYIALQSRFITCGSYEGHYIIDGLLENESDIQPKKLHGDTHAQNFSVFALTHVLGIELMPRIRRIKELRLYKAERKLKYENINQLLDSTPINWAIIERHWRDIVRIAVSIKLGKINASTILRRFGSKNQKSKLHLALEELGKAIRTKFLLKYIDDVRLRRMISAATNKCEEFNNFIRWVFFGNQGVIANDIRHEQQKLIKYNHLVANLLILHNVQQMSGVLADLRDSGMEITREMLSGLGPYRTMHVNRFGEYALDITREIAPVNLERRILPAEEAAKGTAKPEEGENENKDDDVDKD